MISNNGKYRIAQWSNLSLTPAMISEKSDILKLTLSIHYPQCHQINGHKTRMLYSPSLWGCADSGPSLQPCTLYRKTHISLIPPRQIAHWSHHSALVILILFTPIKKKTAKHRAGRHESPQLPSLPMLATQRRFSLENQNLTTWEVLGRVVTLIAYPFPSTGSCMPAEILRSPTRPCLRSSSLSMLNSCFSSDFLSNQGNPDWCCIVLCTAAWVLQWRGCLKAVVLLWNLSFLPDHYKDHASTRAIALSHICIFVSTFCYAQFILIFLMPWNNYSFSLSFAGTTTEENREIEGQETWALRLSEEALGSEESDVSFQPALQVSVNSKKQRTKTNVGVDT